MKLVELLARELDAWPIGTVSMTQDDDGAVNMYDHAFPTTLDTKCTWRCIGFTEYLTRLKEVASDQQTAIVTIAQWQAERDRQKGGEWKRHRGGKCPVPAGAKVSTRHRDGKVVDVHFHTATTNSGAATMNAIWKHTGDAHDIMSYKVISQPSSKAEARAPFGGDPIIEYAFGAPGEDMASLDWKPLGKCKISDIEFDSAETEEDRVKDTTVGTLAYKLDIDTGPAMQALNELSAKWDQVESPFKWRDEVTELNAYIEKFTRERDELIERLASEGFALITPVVSVVSEFAGVDMGDWRNWKVGDIVEATEECTGQYSIGTEYKIRNITSSGRIGTVLDDCGNDDNGWGHSNFKFVRRP